MRSDSDVSKPNLVEWITCTIDSNFSQMVVLGDATSFLHDLRDYISDHLAAFDAYSQLFGTLRQFHSVLDHTRPESSSEVKPYQIEVLRVESL